MAKSTLTKEQKKALDALLSGKNVFLTGEAGTGKSYVTNTFIKRLKRKHKNVLITAPTGVAAINVGGTTLHRAFKAGSTPLIDKRQTFVPEVVDEADIIIIDEISMCRIDLFEYVARIIFASEAKAMKPKQVIVIGDFFQLPPVTTKDDAAVLRTVYDSEKFYAFESPLWKDFKFECICLTQVIRQNDPSFIEQLNKARIGDTSCVDYFNTRIGSAIDGGIILCSTNKRVEEINEQKLQELGGRSNYYIAKYEGEFKESECLAERVLSVKLGCRVMALINDSKNRYQNGSVGTVVDFGDDFIEVEFDNGEVCSIGNFKWNSIKYEVEEEYDDNNNKCKKLVTKEMGSCSQIPLKLAYAITMHKSQGQTFDKVNLIPMAFDVGQLYVALSRVRTLNGLKLLSRMSSEHLKCNQKVLDFYASFSEDSSKYELSNKDRESINEVGMYVLNHLELFAQALPEQITAQLAKINNRRINA